MSGEYVAGRYSRGDLLLDCDVVIVGSGAGGAVVALHLAEAGHDVIVLEEGGRVRPEQYARMRPSETMRHLWRDSGLSMVLGLGRSPMINLMTGRTVGGSSVLTGGVCFRIPEAVLDGWVRERGLSDFTSRRLEPFYQDVERRCHVSEVPVHMRSRSTQLFEAGAQQLGYGPLQPMHRNTRDCVGWSTCNFGCPAGRKLSVDVSYLPGAVSAGARVYSDCRVERVEIHGDRAVGVTGRVLEGPHGGAGSRFKVRARRVVVACGALHSPRLLVRSGVGRQSRQVGRNLTLHPSFRIMARFDERVDGWRGSLQSAFSSQYEPEGIQLNSVFVPAGILAAAMPGLGDRHRERASQLSHLAIFGANLHDDPGGVVRRGLGREPLVTYRMSDRDQARLPRALQICADTFFAAGAREVFLPVLGLDGLDADSYRRLDLSRLPPRRLECTSQHPLGTCRMGVDASRSVVDIEHRAHDVRELYVVDGSAVPTSLGVNPQLSIMTLATRAAWCMRERRFLG